MILRIQFEDKKDPFLELRRSFEEKKAPFLLSGKAKQIKEVALIRSRRKNLIVFLLGFRMLRLVYISALLCSAIFLSSPKKSTTSSLKTDSSALMGLLGMGGMPSFSLATRRKKGALNLSTSSERTLTSR